ncbi:MAG: PBP1A family penicillin-binding protein [Clostridiales bacterium]|jgi:penicillin-binding protein 1A|nr:PBP1A family penicillin-binding protein [Clostridiales bacterium]
MSNSVKLFVKIFIGITLLGIIVVTGVVAGALLGFIDTTGDLNIEDLRLNATSFVYYTDPETGETGEYERLYGEENRVWVDITETPDYFRDCFVAIEDERFYKHAGFDVKSTSKAVFDYVLRRNGRGASTITQQIVKNLTGDKEVSPTRKAQEIIRAVNLEKKMSKEQILELYMNVIYLSEGCHGVGSAANYYFGKDVSELTLAECASIAGITQYPSRFDPITNPEANKEKQVLILSKMLQLGYIDEETYQNAVAEPLNFVGKLREAASKQSYFVDQVISDVLRDLRDVKGYTDAVASKMLYTGGLRIYSTVDPLVQSVMDKVYTDPKSFQAAPKGVTPESAMVMLDPLTGEVKGVVGGRGEKTADRTLNRATQSFRQPGSAIKPIAVYAPAVENNLITPATVFSDKSVTFGSWSPRNYYAGFRGPASVSYALEISINTIPVQILEKMGAGVSVNFMRNNLGVTSLTAEDQNLAIALGGLTKGISPLELTAAYAPFVNRGIYTKPVTYTKVLDSAGKVLLENKKQSAKAMSEQTAAIMANMLKGVVDYGTGASARFNTSYATGGKTGTTDNDVDRWFVGFTPYYAASVWVGCDNPRSMSFFSGNPCIPVWKKVMQEVHAAKKLPAKGFAASTGLVSATYCTESGALPGDQCASVRTSYFKSGTQPVSVCTAHEAEVDPTEESSETNGETEDGSALPEKSAVPQPGSSAPPSSSAPPGTVTEPVNSTAPEKPVDLGEPNV